MTGWILILKTVSVSAIMELSGCNTGVRKKVTEVNPKAIYIHCNAHQLNLALVDTCKSLDHASQFFSLLQSLYNYISSSIPHAVFMKKQKEFGSNVVQLKRLSDTRWSCRYTSIKAVLTSLSAILGNRSRAVFKPQELCSNILKGINITTVPIPYNNQ